MYIYLYLKERNMERVSKHNYYLDIAQTVADPGFQPNLFADRADREKRRRLMKAVDAINASSLAHDNVHIASYMPAESLVNSNHRSPQYTSRINDIIDIHANGL